MFKAIGQKYGTLPSETRLSVRCFITDTIVTLLFVTNTTATAALALLANNHRLMEKLNDPVRSTLNVQELT